MSTDYLFYCLGIAAIPVSVALASQRLPQLSNTERSRVWWSASAASAVLASPTILFLLWFVLCLTIVWVRNYGRPGSGGSEGVGVPGLFIHGLIYSAFIGLPAAVATTVLAFLPPAGTSLKLKKVCRFIGVVMALLLTAFGAFAISRN